MDSIEENFLALVEPINILKTAAKIYRDISERNLFENPLSLRENMFYNGRMFERVTLALIELGEDVARFEKIHTDYQTMVSTASKDAQEYFSTLMMGELWKGCADYLCAILAKVANKSPKTNGKPIRKRTKNSRGKQLTPADITRNKGLNLVLDELRRRANAIQKKRGISFADALSDAYEAMSNDIEHTTAEWRKYFNEVEKKTLLDRVKHKRKYTVLIS
jgi:hypothetical protein